MQRSLFNDAVPPPADDAPDGYCPDWITPPEVAAPIIVPFGLGLDVCATKEAAQCKKFFTPEDDCFEQEWHGDCYMNPRYGKEIGFFLAKALREVNMGRARVVALLPDNIDSPWFRKYCDHFPMLIWPERIHFIHPVTGKRGTQPANGNIVVAMGYMTNDLPRLHIPTREQGTVTPFWKINHMPRNTDAS